MHVPNTPQNALIDFQTNAVLVLNQWIGALIYLREGEADSRMVYDIQWPNYIGSTFLADLEPNTYPKWSWDGKRRELVPTSDSVLSDSVISRSKLLVAKRDVLNSIIRNLNLSRLPLRTGVEQQEFVYLTKKLEAQRFRDLGYADERIMEFPFVLQYADFAKISTKEAADDILFKAKLDDELLAKTELLRLKYFNEIRNARSPEDLPTIYEAFMREGYRNALV